MTARTLTPFDPAAVRDWTLGEGRRGVLLLHGFAGTPPELRRLGEHLAAHGYRCRGPALAGHASTPEALEATTRRDWTASAQAELDSLAGECDEVMLAGQSMGGTIALHLAATDLRIAAVATLATPIWLSRLATWAVPLARRVMRWQRPGDDIDLYDLDAIDELHSHGLRPMRSIQEFVRLLAEVRDQLPAIRAPVLVLHGGRDRTIDPANAAEIARRLVCSRAVRHRSFPRSGHGMSVDVDREQVNACVLEWFDSHSRTAGAARSTASA
ncbi:MAG: alpha/beta hydrolase [Candidatus Dormibacteria bacterium]